jgi:hypothetical protein
MPYPEQEKKFDKEKLQRFKLANLSFLNGMSLYGSIVPEHLISCADTFECQHPCPYESGMNRYLYLDGELFSSERLKLGGGNIIVKHEVRGGEKFLEFQDYQTVHKRRSPYVGKIVKKVSYNEKFFKQ